MHMFNIISLFIFSIFDVGLISFDMFDTKLFHHRSSGHEKHIKDLLYYLLRRYHHHKCCSHEQFYHLHEGYDFILLVIISTRHR